MLFSSFWKRGPGPPLWGPGGGVLGPLDPPWIRPRLHLAIITGCNLKKFSEVFFGNRAPKTEPIIRERARRNVTEKLPTELFEITASDYWFGIINCRNADLRVRWSSSDLRTTHVVYAKPPTHVESVLCMVNLQHMLKVCCVW